MTQDTDAGDRGTRRPAEPVMLPTAVGSLRVRDTGQGGVPVLLVHGLGGDLGLWAFNQPALSQRRRAVSFDLPGHAGSTKDIGDATVPTLA
ncbi:MAG: alpha/beta fold hydrolase, partial [Alphaproteobacteria bacterium]